MFSHDDLLIQLLESVDALDQLLVDLAEICLALRCQITIVDDRIHALLYIMEYPDDLGRL